MYIVTIHAGGRILIRDVYFSWHPCKKEATPSQHIVCYTSSSQKPEVSGWPGDGARATTLPYQSNCGKVEDCLDHTQPVDVPKVLRHCQQEIQDCYTCIMYASSFGCFAHSSQWTALCRRSDEIDFHSEHQAGLYTLNTVVFPQ